MGNGDPSSLYPYIIDDDNGPPGRDNGNGIFFRNATVTIAQITDGTSQTFLAGERSQNLSRATWTGAITNASVPLIALQAQAGLDPEARPRWSLRTPARHMARMPIRECMAISTGHCIRAGPTSCSPMAWPDSSKSRQVFPIFQALATRQGGEVLSADQF